MKKFIIFFTFCFASIQIFAAPIVDVAVKALDGFGGKTSSVLTRCQTKVGAQYDPVIVSRDVNTLNASGEYQEITVDARRVADGIEVVFYVKRKIRFHAPLIVNGATEFNESKIASLAELKDGFLYSEGELAAAAARVRKEYQKKYFPFAKVTPIPRLLSGNNCEITFLIDEGERHKIRNYVFNGAEEVPEVNYDVLNDLVGNIPWWNPKGWFNDPAVTREQLAFGVQAVKDYFCDLGYLDAIVQGPKLESIGNGKADLVYTIIPGSRYYVSSVKIIGLTHYPEEVVARKSFLPEIGAIAGAKALSDAARRIEIVVGSGDVGLADTHVEVRKMPSGEEEGALDVVFKVNEGVKVVINDVLVEGNDYTKDKVIRREIALAPGDRMLEDRAVRSQKRLENLDYFSRVRYYLRKTNLPQTENGEEVRDLVYEVEEKNTGSFMIGVGASSVDSVYLSAEVSQANFDLFAPSKMFRGGGQKARFFAQAGPRIQTYEANITEPYLFDRLLELSVEAYRRQRWYDDYDIVRTGGGISLSYPVKFWPTGNAFGRLGFRLSGELIQFEDYEDTTWVYGDRIVSIKDEDKKYGDAFEPVLRVYWAHDTRDSFRMPTSGSRTQIFVDFAPAGDNHYARFGINHRTYFPIWKKYGHVLMIAARAETIEDLSDDIPIYNRLFLGGPKSIRGIEYRGVSPYARRRNGDGSLTDLYDPWGGQTLVCLNLEYTVPIFKMLRLAAFSDIGAVSADSFDISDEFAWTIGLGVRLDLPMFPIRLDFGTPIKKPEHAKKETFSFTVGYEF